MKFGDRGGCNAPRDVGKTTAEEPSKGKAGKGTVEREGPGALGERPGVSGDKPVRKKRQLSLSQALRLGKKQEAKTEQQAKATGGGDAPALPEISSPKLRSACAEGAKAENAGSPSKTRADEGGNPRCQERRKNVSEVGRLAEKVQTKQSEGLSAADTHDSGSDFMGGDENNMASANPCGTSRPHRPLKTPKKGSAAAEGDHGAAGIEAKAAGDSISEAPTADGGQADAGREPTAARAVTKMTNSGRIGRVRHKAHKIVDLIKVGACSPCLENREGRGRDGNAQQP